MKHYKRRSMVIVFLFIIMISNMFLFETSVHAESTSGKNVLILNSYSKGNSFNRLPFSNWCDEIIYGIESEFKNNNENVSLNVQYMDSAQNSSDQYYDMLYNLYKYKFNNTKFDAIIALDNNATNFLIKYSDDLFPNIPVVFSGVDQDKQSTINNHPLFTGIYKNEDFKSTFDIALKLHPNTKQFFILLDKTSQGLNYKKLVDQLVPLYSNRVDFLFCDDEDINVVKEKINTLPNNTVIFTATQFKGSTGKFIPLAEVNNILFEDSPLPIYSPWCSYLNNGIVGGKIADGPKLGSNLREITSRILNGEEPNHIPAIIDDAYKYAFNFDQLKRFNIDMSSIPKDSTIINMPSSTFSLSKTTAILIMGCFILVLILIIVSLLLIIHKLKTTKKLLSNSESLLRTIIDSTPDIICLKDPNGLMLQCNNSFLELLNIKEKNYKFKSLNELIGISSLSRSTFENYEECDYNAWESGEIYRTEEVVQCQKDVLYKTYDIIRVPLFNKDKTRRGLLLQGRDITEHKANEENKKVIKELKYYDKLRVEFFTNLSHELRTPLNVISSSLQVVDLTLNNSANSKTELNKLTRYTNVMKQNCYRLAKLINNFMDLSKIESGGFSLQLQNRDIINIVESIVLSIADYIESKGISIIFDTEVEEQIIACDPNMIERIILNLLSNSIKFTPNGGSITVNMYYRNDSILISVKDTGIGIPLQKQEAIFQRFVQVDKSLSRNHEGSGIGLSLVKSLVELHNGTLTLVSEPNKGSEFILRLNAEPLTDIKDSAENYNLSQDKTEMIKMEFSDI